MKRIAIAADEKFISYFLLKEKLRQRETASLLNIPHAFFLFMPIKSGFIFSPARLKWKTPNCEQAHSWS